MNAHAKRQQIKKRQYRRLVKIQQCFDSRLRNGVDLDTANQEFARDMETERHRREQELAFMIDAGLVNQNSYDGAPAPSFAMH